MFQNRTKKLKPYKSKNRRQRRRRNWHPRSLHHVTRDTYTIQWKHRKRLRRMDKRKAKWNLSQPLATCSNPT